MASTVTVTPEPAVLEALQRAADYAFEKVDQSTGHWCGELKSNVTITSEYIFLRQAFGLSLDADREAYRSYLLSEQNPDGSWSIAPGVLGDVSTTAEAYLALKILGVSTEKSPEMQRAREAVLRLGGIAKIRVFTRIFFATFGLFPWQAVPQLPVELILLPSASPINIYKLASWARSTIVPLLLVCHHQPIYPLPNGTSPQNDYLDELWLNPEQKMVPYAPPLQNLVWSGGFIDIFFTAVDNILATLGGLRWVPLLRSYARRQCVKWILDRQEPSGDWAGIFPAMHGGIYGLMAEGFDIDSSPIRRGIQALENFAWQDAVGKRIQACVSPVWDTALMSVALCDSELPRDARLTEHLDRALDWLKGQQKLGPEGDWRVYRPELTPGGFTFEIHNSWYPDVDDTAVVILGLVKQDPRAVTLPTVTRAQEWILGMQNRDGGWAAFDHQNNALWLNKIPFSDMGSLCDPSTADVTGRIIECFGILLQSYSEKHTVSGAAARLRIASRRAIDFLVETQEDNGSWFGRWGVNYIYGTSNVLNGLKYFVDIDKRVPALVASAVRWLKSVQNPDGGWGRQWPATQTRQKPERAHHHRLRRPGHSWH
ncbi:Squalene hopane cyclase afumA [Cladobotryum mycophilum]|uniref:Squalene hopane cyclase afumA n=1 Tax=Cladobotryum mycophilum TaxID=491253 RepID=A0ABR0SC97_9HYPO